MLVSYLAKLLLPLAGTVAAIRVAKRRGLALDTELGLAVPRVRAAATWLVAWVGWIAVSELIIQQFGLAQAERWAAMPALVLAARIGALVVTGPAVEEVVSRGLGLALLRRRGWTTPAALLATSALWAAAHFRYGAVTVLMMTADGLMLGCARVATGSLWTSVLMHGLANAFSVTQSLGWATRWWE